MHVDDALRGPDPVVLVRLAGGPFDSAEVDAPLGANGGLGDLGLAEAEGRPGIGDLDGPALVGVGGVVEGALDGDRGLEVGDVPGVVGAAVVVVGPVEVEIPGGVEGVDLKLVVAGSGGAWFDEDLEVVVAEDDGVDTPANAYSCTWCAWRVAARSALALALISLARDFSVYALWS